MLHCSPLSIADYDYLAVTIINKKITAWLTTVWCILPSGILHTHTHNPKHFTEKILNNYNLLELKELRYTLYLQDILWYGKISCYKYKNVYYMTSCYDFP